MEHTLLQFVGGRAPFQSRSSVDMAVEWMPLASHLLSCFVQNAVFGSASVPGIWSEQRHHWRVISIPIVLMEVVLGRQGPLVHHLRANAQRTR